MQYRYLGRSGLRVSEVCLGTMNIGVTTELDEARELVAAAVDEGVNFVDTANTYAGGRCETILGEALKGYRDKVVLATKFVNSTGPGPNDGGMSRKHIMEAIEGSLRRLQTDYVDLYYIHHVDGRTPIEEALRALDDLVHQGKVRYIGCSNLQAWRVMDSLWTSEMHGLARYVAYQPQYSLVMRDIEIELVPACLHKGVGIVCWGPLASGFLTGKYQPGQRVVAGTRSEAGWAFHQRFFAPTADETLAELLKVSAELGKTPAQVALRWALEQPGITSVIAGARNAQQFRDSCGAMGWRLEGEPLARLTQMSAPRLTYPEAMERGMDERRDGAIKTGR
jgi:aryl-alcohol dehydrogenase-like predicted oxidoreductase